MRPLASSLSLALLCSACFAAPSHAQDKAPFIWREGEAPSRSTLKRHPWWYDKVNPGLLSGGDWIGQFTAADPGVAEYDVDIPSNGSYHLWLRANPIATKMSMQLDNAPWTPISEDKKSGDAVNVAADGALDIRFVQWMDAGTLSLTPGKHTLKFRFESANNFHGALDCFVLTTSTWAPNGILKPGQADAAKAQAPTETNSWAFEPGEDPFRADAALDLRFLNEKFAGEHGFIKLSPDGNDFVRGDGQPIRFWCANTTLFHAGTSVEDMKKQARTMAKAGVNMVRLHASISPKADGARLEDVDRDEIDRIWKFVAAMKAEGIYCTISPFWANGGHSGVRSTWGLEGYTQDKNDIWGLLFFNPKLQAAYKKWVQVLYGDKNPYTGIALKDDPAVGIIQVLNEDSLFFWTTSGIKPEQLSILQARYAAWLSQKYGSLDKARASWQNVDFPRDDWKAAKPDIDIWRMTQPQSGGTAARIHDQVEFLGTLQRAFYEDIARHYHSIGCKQVINAANWQTADNVQLGDVERWTYEATDVAAVNKYYNGGPHVGANNGWRIDPGDTFGGQSVLLNPGAFPLALKQPAGHPMLVTESSWVAPLGYQSEGPFLIAAYSGLLGIDGFYWFSWDAPGYKTDQWISWDKKSQFKWSLSPSIQTMFPACALMFRRGDIAQAPVVVHEERSLQNLWDRTTPIIAEGRSFDPNRQSTFAEGTGVKTEVDPLAFLAGRVEAKYEGDPEKTRVADLSKLINTQAKTVTSATGQLKWNYGIGVCTLDAPRAQGATGFLQKAGPLKMSTLSIETRNEYATILAVSLDERPLASTSRALLQIGTEMRPTGWKQTPGTFKDGDTPFQGYQIVSTGQLPYREVNTQATITLRNPNFKSATLLDANGYRAGKVEVQRVGGELKIVLPPNALWVVVE